MLLDGDMRVEAADQAGALSTFGMPTSGVAWITCRCRFDSETTSSSMTPSVPTPAAAR